MEDNIYNSFGKNLYRSSSPVVPEGQTAIGEIQSLVGAGQSNLVNPDNLDLSSNTKINLDGSVSIKQSDIGSSVYSVTAGEDIIQKMIDLANSNGGGIVFLKNGTHKPSSSLSLYSNVYLEGENADSTIIDFVNNTRSILIQGTNAYTTGTLSVTNNSTSVTGSGTSWSTNVVAGMYILLGGIWYPITVVGSDTSITLGIPYAGVTLVAGTTYTIAAIKNDIKVMNLTIKNANDGINIQYANEVVIRDVNIQSSVTAITATASSQIQYDQVDLVANNAGLSMTNVHFTKAGELGVIDALAGNGITLNTITNSSFQSIFVQNSSADGMNLTSCSNLNIFGSFVENGEQGIELVSGNSDIALIGGAYENNGGDGIKLTATTDNLQMIGNSIKDNGGYGVNVAASTCDGNNITGNNFSGNSSGAVNDSGTGTLIRGNVGVDDNSTNSSGIISKQFTASENITAQDAVYIVEDPVTDMAFDASASGTSSGSTTLSYSHTCTGNNRILIVWIQEDTASSISSVTYNGVAMTHAKTHAGPATYQMYAYYLIAPATGSNTIAITRSGSTGVLRSVSSSYTQAKQDNQLDATNSGNNNSTSVTASVTTVNDKSWAVMAVWGDNLQNYTASGSTDRNAGLNYFEVFDTNAQTTPVGLTNITATCTAQNNVWIALSIRPLLNVGIKRADASAAGTSNSFIGFAPFAITSGNDGIVYIGGVVSGFSGLTVGGQYYLSDTTGAIASSAGTVTRKVGVAVSLTELLITNIW